MDSIEVIKFIFGATVITAIAAILAILSNYFNIRDRFEKWRDKRKKAKFKKSFHIENPAFKFTLHHVSGHPIGKCILSATVLNTSKEVKFIDALSYEFYVPRDEGKYHPPTSFINGEKWPKRLEYGERFNVSIDYYSTLVNSLFQYWQRGVDVFAKCQSTTGDRLRSNSIKFDSLVNNSLEPLNEDYQKLAALISKKTNGSQREIEASLWQLQLFGRLTSHIGRQLQQNNIPIAEYLVVIHKLVPQQDLWYHWDKVLWGKNISPPSIVKFLRALIDVKTD